MNEPLVVTFDVWANVDRAHAVQAREVIQRSRPDLSRTELLKMIARGASSNEPFLVTRGVSWGDAQRLREDFKIVGGTVTIYQHDFGPNLGTSHYCSIHDFFYGGCLGCPVCRGWFK